MIEVNVSREALTRVKSSLSDYRIDISGFAARVEQRLSEVSKSAEFEIQSLVSRIAETINSTNRLKVEIKRLIEAISQMSSEKNLTEQRLETTQNLLAAKQDDAAFLRRRIAAMEGDSVSNFGVIESEIRCLHSEIRELNKHLLQLQQKISGTYAEQSEKEDELRVAERLLDRLQNKHEKMKSAFTKLNDNMNVLLTASKSFEMRATSKTDSGVSGIDKCIAAIDAYLT